MDRLIAVNSVPYAQRDTAPALGTPQYATDGNPAAGFPPTDWPAYIFNCIQDEILAVITAAGIAPDRNDWGQLLEALRVLTPGRLLKVQTFVASGFYTPTLGMRTAIVEVQDGGAGGAGAYGSPGYYAAGGGGTGGSYGRSLFAASQIGAGVQVTVGAAGQGGAGLNNANNNGGNGGISSFGTLLSGTGSLGGLQGLGTTSTSYSGLGIGQTPSGVVLGANLFWRLGQEAWDGSSCNGYCRSGAGGDSQLGFGGGDTATNQAGHNASGYGAGGSGGTSANGAGGQPGGNGSPGIVIVTEFS